MLGQVQGRITGGEAGGGRGWKGCPPTWLPPGFEGLLSASHKTKVLQENAFRTLPAPQSRVILTMMV